MISKTGETVQRMNSCDNCHADLCNLFKVVPNTFTKINLAHFIFIKFWHSICFDPLTKM